LSYGFAHAFTEAERGQLAVLHLFRDTIDAEALRFMGDPDITESDAVPQLAGLTSDAAIALLDRAAAIGLLSGLGGGYYTIHPALPWYFTTLFAAAYGPPASPAARQAVRAYTHTFAVTLEHLGYILSNQDDPGCLPYYEEALSLYQRISARAEEARLALTLGNTYKDVPGLRDLGQAEHWYQHSLTHRADNDTLGRAKTLASLGILAYGRFDEARDAREPEPVLLAHLNTALDRLQQALALLPPDDAEDLAAVHGQLGNIYRMAGDTRQALRHYQQSIAHEEARGNTYGAGRTRFNIALLLEGDGRRADALLYARAALSDFERVGSGATQQATKTQDLITRLEGNSP
jgi:tetratricopeptide (TPR) repeat protein